MAQNLPPSGTAEAPRATRHWGWIAGMTVLFAGFFVFMFGTTWAAITWFVHPVAMALLGMMLLMAGGVIAAFTDWPGDTSAAPQPDPRPSENPAVSPPATHDCPNCGAPPRAIDSLGIATCEYCETRFVVR